MNSQPKRQGQKSQQKMSIRGPGKNSKYDFLFRDDFGIDEDDTPLHNRQRQIHGVSTPAIDIYYQKAQIEKSNKRREQSISAIDKIAICIIIALMAFWSVIFLSLASTLANTTAFLGLLIGLVAYWGITWIFYYVWWRFFWIMVALGWMMFTGYALTILGTLQHIFYQFF